MKAIRSTVNELAARLRALSVEAVPDALLGSEDGLVAELGGSRVTIRQAARILEREGFLSVRRGVKGGYFAARPDLSTVERVASTYLEVVDADPVDLTRIASLMWVEAVRKACELRSTEVRDVVAKFERRLAKMRGHVFNDILEIEQSLRSAIFDLTNARYIELIFTINAAFARRHMPMERFLVPRSDDDEFFHRWRRAKLMELQAIADGDAAVGTMAALHSRHLWAERIAAITG